jgi:hypothetical protein
MRPYARAESKMPMDSHLVFDPENASKHPAASLGRMSTDAPFLVISAEIFSR